LEPIPKSFPWPVHSVQGNYPQIFCDVGRKLTAWQITLTSVSSQAASDDRLFSHVTLGLVECRKQTASAQIAERFRAEYCRQYCGHSTQYSHNLVLSSVFCDCVVSWDTTLSHDCTWRGIGLTRQHRRHLSSTSAACGKIPTTWTPSMT